ncbi:unnamed protein product, partial [Rotaria sordida]
MPVIQRNNSAVSSASTVSRHTNVTHCIVQHPDNEKTRKIVHMNKIVNPSNRRLKVGDDCTLKGEGRNHTRVKILFCGDLDTCQHQLDIIAINSAPKASPVQPKNVPASSSCNGSETSKAVTYKTQNKKNSKPRGQEIDMLEKDDDIRHSKEVSNTTMFQSRNPVQLPTSNTFVARNVSNQVLTQKSSKQGHFNASSSRSSPNYEMDFETLDSNKKQSNENANIAAGYSANDEFLNLSNDDKYDDNDDDCGIFEDSEADQTTTTIGKSGEKQVKEGETYDELLVKYKKLSDKYQILKNKVTALQQQNEMLNATTLPMPPPEIQQWFVHTAQRFENKPLSGAVLKDFSRVLKLPVNVLISLKQNTGTLTARAIVRHLFPSKNRTTDDMTENIRQSILDQIQSILASENNFTLHSSPSSCYNSCITDIQHANWYQSIALNENTSNFITLLLNVDGISISDSSDNSLWIFTFIINEINRTRRYKLQNCIFGGIWPGPQKPNREQTYAMLKLMTDELQLLENENAFTIKALGNQMVKLKVFLIGSTCDKPAQAIVQNVAEPIGEFGCGRCEIPGITVPSRDGGKHYIRVFPLSSKSRNEPECRSNKNYDRIMALKNATDQQRKGYLGPCALRALNEKLSQYRYPSTTSRTPRPIVKFHRFKANEFRLILLFAAPVLKHYLKPAVFKNYLLLVFALHLAESRSLQYEDIVHIRFLL